METWIVEAIGYAASALIALSLLMVSVLKLRIINLMGSACFVLYGGLIGSIPLMLTNMFIIVINAVNLQRLRVGAGGIRYSEMGGEHRVQVQEFAAAFLTDIRRFFPWFTVEQIAAAERSGGRVFAAIRHLRVVGVAVVAPVATIDNVLVPGEAELVRRCGRSASEHCFLLDYILPRYRGLGLVRGLHELVIHHVGPSATGLLAIASSRTRAYPAFLRHNGFQLIAEEQGLQLYRKPLGS